MTFAAQPLAATTPHLAVKIVLCREIVVDLSSENLWSEVSLPYAASRKPASHRGTIFTRIFMTSRDHHRHFSSPK